MEEPNIKPQYKLFAINYVGKCCGNAERSAICAGYSKSYARGNAHKLVARRDIQEYMEYLRSKNSMEVDIMTAQELQKFWSDTIKDDAVLTRDKLRASELLAKAQGQFSNDW